MDRQKARLLGERAEELLKALAAEHGMKVSRPKGGKYGPDYSVHTFQFTENTNGEAAGPQAQAFRELATFYGLKPEDLNLTFTHNHRTFTLVGLNSRASKMPLVVKIAQGGSYKMSLNDSVKASIERARPVNGGAVA